LRGPFQSPMAGKFGAGVNSPLITEIPFIPGGRYTKL
jgi:hypothetical protein